MIKKLILSSENKDLFFVMCFRFVNRFWAKKRNRPLTNSVFGCTTLELRTSRTPITLLNCCPLPSPLRCNPDCKLSISFGLFQCSCSARKEVFTLLVYPYLTSTREWNFPSLWATLLSSLPSLWMSLLARQLHTRAASQTGSSTSYQRKAEK